MVCSGHAGGNGLLHKPSWSHSDEGDQSPEGRKDMRGERMWREREKKGEGKKGQREKGDNRLLTVQNNS